ncbi:MAG TPA: hypothetical protein VFW62_11350 [bacterium]|nr:hypothetical protein [bacterium]
MTKAAQDAPKASQAQTGKTLEASTEALNTATQQTAPSASAPPGTSSAAGATVAGNADPNAPRPATATTGT